MEWPNRFLACHLTLFYFRFFETFWKHASCNKLCGSANFIIFGPTDQKLWVFEIFRRSLGRASMCWSQLTTCAKKWEQKEEFFFAKGGCRTPGRDRRALALQPSNCVFLSSSFWFFKTFFWKFGEWARPFGRMGVQHTHFLKLAPTLGSVKSCILHGTWRFYFISIFLLKLEDT
jgi:hypothetical protein